MAVKLVTDSTAYLDANICSQLDIKVVSLGVNFPDEFYPETEVDYDYFYRKIEKDNVIPTSSQPSSGMIYKVFAEIAEEGHDVLGIFISSALSGTLGSAVTAREMMQEKYKGTRVEIMDSGTTCMALGLQVIEAAEAARQGRTMEEIMAAVRHSRDRIHFYFVPLTLDYLQKGGRIGGASRLVGSILKIKPILYVNREGRVDVYEKVRGLPTAINHIYKNLKKDVDRSGLKNLVVHHVNDLQRGQALALELGEIMNLSEVPIVNIGPVIGLHVGPGAFGIVYRTG